MSLVAELLFRDLGVTVVARLGSSKDSELLPS